MGVADIRRVRDGSDLKGAKGEGSRTVDDWGWTKD